MATAFCCSRSASVRYTWFAFTTSRLSGSERNKYAAEEACIIYSRLSCSSDRPGTFCSHPTISGGLGMPTYGSVSCVMYVCKNRSSILRRAGVSGRFIVLLIAGMLVRHLGLGMNGSIGSSPWMPGSGDGFLDDAAEEEGADGGAESKMHDWLPMRVQLLHIGRFSSHCNSVSSSTDSAALQLCDG